MDKARLVLIECETMWTASLQCKWSRLADNGLGHGQADWNGFSRARRASVLIPRSVSASESVDDVPGDGNRVKKVPNGVTTICLGAMYEKNLTSGEVTRYYFAGSQRVAMRKGSSLYYFVTDHLGSTSLALDSNGNEIANTREKYYPFGETRGTVTPVTDRQFTGQRREDPALGSLYDYGARMYSPALGRFLSADTIVPGAENPQAWNRYAYTFNNPLKYNDPSGHCPWCIPAVIIALLLAGCNSSSSPSANTQAADATILNSTVALQIVDEKTNSYSAALSTYLGRVGDQSVLYTHDHFGKDGDTPPENATRINAFDAKGNPLNTFSRPEYSRVQLSAGESSLLLLSGELPGVTSANITLFPADQLQIGQQIDTPAHKIPADARGGLKVVWGDVTDTGNFAKMPNAGIQSRGITADGDSGGGAWTFLNGNLVLIGNIRAGLEFTRSFLEIMNWRSKLPTGNGGN
jgi:RHS repeat-associated protein